MFFTVILIWGLVIFANAVVYEILKPKDEIIVYKPINEITQGWRELEAPF